MEKGLLLIFTPIWENYDKRYTPVWVGTLVGGALFCN